MTTGGQWFRNGGMAAETGHNRDELGPLAPTGRAVLLAAGRGVRLRPLTDSIPKPLTEVAGQPLLVHAFRFLEALGVGEVLVVLGYRGEAIRDVAIHNGGKLALSFVSNERFATTNNSYSLYLGMDFLANGGFLLEADTIFRRDLAPAILEGVTKANADVLWVATDLAEQMSGCKLQVDASGGVRAIQITGSSEGLVSSSGLKSTGLLYFSQNGANTLRRILDGLEENAWQKYYDLILGEHLDEIAVKALLIPATDWAEIDNEEDLLRARRLFS